jgi:putative tryptophan/tyrosine transport system substrate-binding protein
MRRRNFITLIGGAAVWPVAAQAQPSVIPVIGLVNVGTPIDSLTEAFRQGLAELGYIEGRNVVIDYRNADNRYERLPELVTELVRRPVTLIVAITTPQPWPPRLLAQQSHSCLWWRTTR